MVIFEGPSGAGKTTLIKKVSRLFENVGVVDVRLYDERVKTQVQGYLNWLARLEEAVRMPEEVVLLDRGPVGLYVYGSIRDEVPPLALRAIPSLVPQLDQFGLPHRKPLFVFVLPSVDEIMRRREKAGKIFPYDPGRELELYWQASDYLSRFYPVYEERVDDSTGVARWIEWNRKNRTGVSMHTFR